jgi:hypothetical protein
MIDAATRASGRRGPGSARGADGSAFPCIVGAEPGADVAVALAAVDVASARGTAEAHTGSGGGFGAHEIDAAATLVELVRLGAELATGQAIGHVVQRIGGRAAVVENGAPRASVETFAEVVIRQAASETDAAARTFAVHELRILRETLEAGPAIGRARAGRTDEPRLRATLRKIAVRTRADARLVRVAVRLAHLMTLTSTQAARDRLPGNALRLGIAAAIACPEGAKDHAGKDPPE